MFNNQMAITTFRFQIASAPATRNFRIAAMRQMAVLPSYCFAAVYAFKFISRKYR